MVARSSQNGREHLDVIILNHSQSAS
jgi:hypothetical protein